MKRHYSGRSDALIASNDGEQGFWPSYADMMSAVALILFFLMLLSYIQNLITGNDLQNTQDILDDTLAQLELTIGKVADAESQLDDLMLELDAAQLNLDAAQLELDSAQLVLSQKEADIAAQQSLIDQQRSYMAAADEELLAMRSQMQTIAVLRLSILEQIRDSIVNVMGDANKVSIGENGSIILSEGVFFDLGSSEIKPDSVPILNQLVQVFGTFLYDQNNAQYVDSIVISGHTDSTGTAEENRLLSTDRANSVLGYLLTQQGGALNSYASYFCAAGYGATRPVADNGTEQGRAANRRIEISMILKDETVLDIVENYLSIEMAPTEAVMEAGVLPAPESVGEPVPAG